MEVMCNNCGRFYSIDDNLYKPEVKNFCSIECEVQWIEKKVKAFEEGEIDGDIREKK